MDIICPKCGEPWDTDELHDVSGKTYQEARKSFFSLGCGTTFEGKPCAEVASESARMSAILADLLGDDVDGIAAMTEDFLL